MVPLKSIDPAAGLCSQANVRGDLACGGLSSHSLNRLPAECEVKAGELEVLPKIAPSMIFSFSQGEFSVRQTLRKRELFSLKQITCANAHIELFLVHLLVERPHNEVLVVASKILFGR